MASVLVPYRERPNVLSLRPVEQTEYGISHPTSSALRSERESGWAHNSTSRLLRLPSELRIQIYEYVLIEPKKWDKRHLPSCESYAASDRLDLPPFRCYDRVDSDTGRPRGLKVENDARHLCARRKGLGLLLVSKQIYEETADVLYDNNTFCFDSAMNFVRAYFLLSHAGRSKVRSLSIMEFTDDYPVSLTEGKKWQKQMADIMASMPALRAVELPVRYFRFDFEGHLAKLRKLERITIVTTSPINNWPWSWPHRFSIYMALRREYPVPFCSDKIHWSRESCRRCETFFRGLHEESETLLRPMTKGGQRWDVFARARLQLSNATHQDSWKPRKMYLNLPLFGKSEIQVWGLPRQTTEEMERDAKKQKRLEEIREWREMIVQMGVRPWKPTVVKYVSEEDEERVAVLKGRSARSYRHQQEEAKTDRETMLQQRSHKRINVAKREKVSQQQDQMIKKEAKLKAMNEVLLKRRSEKKRAGRRDSK